MILCTAASYREDLHNQAIQRSLFSEQHPEIEMYTADSSCLKIGATGFRQDSLKTAGIEIPAASIPARTADK
jgi:hypothetical protein